MVRRKSQDTPGVRLAAPPRQGNPPMTSSAHAARRISTAAVLLCTGALAAASSAPPTTGPTTPATPPSTPSAPPCSTADLSAAVNTSPGGAAAGSTYYPMNFTNTSKSSCYLFGYPGVSFVTGPSGSQIGEPASRNPAVTPRTGILNAGGTG